MIKQSKTQLSEQARLTGNDTDSKRIRERLLDLEGECKLKKITPIKVSYKKALPLTLLAILLVFPVLFMIWYRKLRVLMWFTQCDLKEASYLFVQDNLNNSSIQHITTYQRHQFFQFKKLKYILNQAGPTPVAFDYESNFTYLSSEINLKMGLDTATVQSRRQKFGSNIHPVQIPNYFFYMIGVLLQPFFLLQYIVCIAYFAEGYVLFGIINIVFSFVTTTINYIMTYISYKKIKDMAQRKIKVRVLRNSEFIEINSDELVPGDLVDFNTEIMCDCILLHESMFANQASLTGENIPIGKFAATNLDQANDSSRWLNEGSSIVQKRHQTLAAVIYTGYATRRGRIIRRILARTEEYPKIFSKALIFQFEAFLVAMIIYFATLEFVKSKNVSDLIIGMRFVDFLAFSFPPTFPIFFNVAYSFALARLKHNNVLCTEPQKTVESCNLQILCFDKTGTLTQNKVEVRQVLQFKDKSKILEITKQINNNIEQNEIIWQLFATCHSVKQSAGQLLGDEVDLRMFLFSKYYFVNDPSACFMVAKQGDQNGLKVLRINQFQSRLQSMSVLVFDTLKKQYYIFVKGAPEKIHNGSTVKIDGLDQVIESLSLEGLRTICFGYKKVPGNQVNHYLQCKRQIFQNNFIILGLVAFENKLKEETIELLDRLAHAKINTKMITGDNIHIAVETAIRAGIISSQTTVLLLEGHKQNINELIGSSQRIFLATAMKRHGGHIQKEVIELNQNMMHLVNNFPIAVDNAFLKLDPRPKLTQSMKVFARISPEGKALIVNQFRRASELQYNIKPFFSRLCGRLPKKIGMCGDGANDLIAIRSADVGIGINNSDASYAATFTVDNLLDIDYVIRDGKTTTANIVSMILYYEFISFLKITATLLLMIDTASLNEKMFFFLSFASSVVFAILLAMNHPSDTFTPRVPNGNLLSLVNHFRFWGSLIIASGGLIGGFYYYISTPQYVPNENPIVTTDWYAYTHSGTCMFLLILAPYSIYPLFFYIGSPWNSKIYKNYLLLFMILFNVGATIILHYITKYCYNTFQMFQISYPVVTIMLLISIGACLAGFVYNLIITEVEQYCNERHNKTNSLANRPIVAN